jgi:hypothetical protein
VEAGQGGAELAAVVRYLELEFESYRPLGGIDPPVRHPLSFALPSDGDLILCDRPEGGSVRLVRAGQRVEEIALPEDFHPRMVADDDEGRVLVAGLGREHNALLLTTEGEVVRRYQLGDGIADLCYDQDGNLLVLRSVRRAGRPLLDRYGPEGDHVDRDEQVQRIMGHTSRVAGRMLVVQRDGTLWLDLSEKYDVDGALLDVIEPGELFGPGRITADRFGWDGIVALSERGSLTAMLPLGRRRSFRLPEEAVKAALGRPLSAEHDLLATRGEHLVVLASDRPAVLAFRMLSE